MTDDESDTEDVLGRLVSVFIELFLEVIHLLKEPIPVLHLRHSLLSPEERSSAEFRRAWGQGVHFINTKESLVRSSLVNIEGKVADDEKIPRKM